MSLRRLRLALLLVALVAPACQSRQAKIEHHQKQGDAYLAQKKTAEAIIEYKNVLQIDPNQAAAHYGLAKAYLASNKLRDGYWELRETARLDPKNLEARLQYGQLARLAGDLDEAEKQADDVIAADPKRAAGYVLRGQVLELRKKPEDARAAYQKAIETAGDDPGPLVLFADFLVRQGDDAAAEPLLRKFVALKPGFASSAALASFLARDRSRDAETEAVYHQAIEHAKPDELSLAIRSYAGFLYSRDRYDEAEKLLKGASAKDPSDLQLIYTLARFYMARGDTAQADAMMEQSAKARPNEVEPFLVLSAYRSRKGDVPGALEAAESALKVDPESQPARLRKAELLLDLGLRKDDKAQIAEARGIVDAVLAKDASSTDGLFVKAKLDMAEQRLDDAVKGLRRALELRADWPQAQYLLASALLMQNDRNGAKAAVTRALELDPTLLDARRLLLRIDALLGDNDLAVEEGRRILKAEPGDVGTRVLVAQSQVRLGKPDDALATLNEIPEKDRTGEVYYAIGRVHLLKNQPARAREVLEKADAATPNQPDILQSLLELDRAQNRLADSSARIAKALEASPNDPRIVQLDGIRLAFLGQNDAAEKQLRHAIDLAPNDLALYGTLAQLLGATGRMQDVVKTYEEASKANPKNGALQLLLGTLYEQQGQLDLAAERYQQALTLDPSLAVAKNNLAYLLAEQGKDLDKALDLAQEAKAALPDNANTADTLGWVLYKKGVPSAAVGYLKEAEGLMQPTDPGLGPVRQHLALAEEASGKPDSARETLERALATLDEQRKQAAAQHPGATLPPEPDWAKDARAHLERLRTQGAG